MSAAPNNGNNNNKMKMSELQAALENIANNMGTRKAKKKMKSIHRKSLKARPSAENMKRNRLKKTRNLLRAKRQKNLSERRMKTIRIEEYGERGMEKLERKLKRLRAIYDAANAGKQADMSVYMTALTTEVQTTFQDNLQEEFLEDYPELFAEEMAQMHPFEYLEELEELVKDLLEQYDEEEINNDQQIKLDIEAETILDAVRRAGRIFDNIGKHKKNESINALINIFGGLGL